MDAPFVPQATRMASDPPHQPVPCLEALRLWPDPIAAHRESESGAWLEWAPGFNVGDIRYAELMQQPPDAVSWQPPLVTLLDHVPGPVLRALDDVPTGLWFTCLRCCFAVPAMIDLFMADRSLAVFLAINWRRGRETMRWAELRRLMGTRRRELLPLLSLPPEEWVLRALRRAHPSVTDIIDYREIRDAFRIDDRRLRRALQHVPVLTPDIVWLLADPATQALVTPALLVGEDCWGLYRLLRQVAVAREVGATRATPKRFTTREQVQAVGQPYGRPDLEDRPYDPCEYPGDWEVPAGECVLVEAEPHIGLTPMRDAFELQGHGLSMETCLATLGRYPAMASDGRAALYQADWDQPTPEFGATPQEVCASMWLRPGEYGWTVAEAGLARNQGKPPAWLMDRVERWAWSLPVDGRRPDPTPEMVAAVEKDTAWRATEVTPFTTLFVAQRGRRAIVRVWWGEPLRASVLNRLVRSYRRHEGAAVQLVVVICVQGVEYAAHGSAAARTRPAVLLGVPNGVHTAIAAESQRVQDQDRELAMAAARAIAIE